MRRGACQHLLKDSNTSFVFCKSSRFTTPTFHSLHTPRRSQLPPLKRQHRLESRIEYSHRRASYSTYLFALVALGGSAFLFSLNRSSQPAPSQTRELAESAPTTSHDPFFTDMPILPGHRGNLTADQEVKLRELWAVTLKTFGVQDPSHPNGTATPLDDTPVISEAETKDDKKKKRRSIFGRKHDSVSSPSKHPDDSDDKYGQVKEYQQILSTQSPESIRAAFWSMVKADHPDALLLRFLRARKWDVDKALVMMLSTMSWRGHEMHVDDDVVFHGEGGALRDSKSSEANTKREGQDFLQQMKLGKSFLHGTDKEGRPLCVVRARLHHGGDQTERSMERYTVYVIETARLVLRPPVETAVSGMPPEFDEANTDRPFCST